MAMYCHVPFRYYLFGTSGVTVNDYALAMEYRRKGQGTFGWHKKAIQNIYYYPCGKGVGQGIKVFGA